MGEVSAREEEPVGKAVAGMRSEGTGDRTRGGPWGDPAFTPSSRRRARRVCSLELARDSGWSLAKRLRETGPEAQRCQGPWYLGSTLEKHTIRHTCPVKTGRGHVCTSAPCSLSMGGLSHAIPSLWLRRAPHPGLSGAVESVTAGPIRARLGRGSRRGHANALLLSSCCM